MTTRKPLTQHQHDTKSLQQALNRTLENGPIGQLPMRCMVITPKSGYRYWFQIGATISHLLYMEDIKLYVRNEGDIDSLVLTTRIHSTDIGMSFELDKCCCMVSKRGTEPREGNLADVQHSRNPMVIRRRTKSKIHQGSTCPCSAWTIRK